MCIVSIELQWDNYSTFYIFRNTFIFIYNAYCSNIIVNDFVRFHTPKTCSAHSLAISTTKSATTDFNVTLLSVTGDTGGDSCYSHASQHDTTCGIVTLMLQSQ